MKSWPSEPSPDSSWPRESGLLPKILGAWTGFVLLFLYAPILILILFSFNSSRLNLRWEGFTLRWYVELFQNTPLLRAFQNSLIVALSTAALSLALALIAAWLPRKFRLQGARFWEALIVIPIFMPEVLMGVSLLLLFVHLQIPLGFTTLIIAHTTFCFPFVLAALRARLHGLDPHLEEAAMDLGATPLTAFRKVILPALTPAILAGSLMAFVLSLDEYIVTLFVSGAHSQTLPLKIFGMAKIGLNPQLNALSTLFILATTAIVLLAEFLLRNPATKTPLQ